MNRTAFVFCLITTSASADPALDGYADRAAAEAVVEVDVAPSCRPGEILWHRDLVTDLCVPRCTSDADCVEGLERCAALPLPGSTSLEERAFVDDEPGLLDHVEAAAEAGPGAAVYDVIAVCDPFFEFEGSLSADLVEVVEVSDEGFDAP